MTSYILQSTKDDHKQVSYVTLETVYIQSNTLRITSSNL